MTKTEAIELLKHHSFTHPDADHPLSENGFLGTLRPFDGKLHEKNFHEVMLILKLLADEFRKEQINNEIMTSFWAICHLGRLWGIEKDGMIQRNALISPEQVAELTNWIEQISDTILLLLEGQNDDIAFGNYSFNDSF